MSERYDYSDVCCAEGPPVDAQGRAPRLIGNAPSGMTSRSILRATHTPDAKAVYGIALMILLAALALASMILSTGCSSAPTPDPDNGVSNASYRQAVTKIRDNLAAVSGKLKAVKDADQAMPQPIHSAAWWDAQIGLVGDTATLASATLAGSTK